MNIVVEHKGTAKSKFTFTLQEIRIKVANKNLDIENELIENAKRAYNMLIDAGWTGITLRGRASVGDSLRLTYSNENKTVKIINNTVLWEWKQELDNKE